MKDQQNDTLRRATAVAPEIRATGKNYVISGYAALFDTVYSMGWFTEEVHRDAFKNADLSDVRVLFNHESSRLFGRTKSKTARVWVDSRGLAYSCTLPKTQDSETLAALISRGDIDASSWGFSLRQTADSNGDRWVKREGKDHRILMDVKEVFDTSPVTFPANPATTVTTVTVSAGEALRSFEAFHANHAGRANPDRAYDEVDVLLLKMQHAQLQAELTDLAQRRAMQQRDAAVLRDVQNLLAEMEAYKNRPVHR